MGIESAKQRSSLRAAYIPPLSPLENEDEEEEGFVKEN
jgi:hypothetical protein